MPTDGQLALIEDMCKHCAFWSEEEYRCTESNEYEPYPLAYPCGIMKAKES